MAVGDDGLFPVVGAPLHDLEAFLVGSLDLRPAHARAIFRAVHEHGATTWDEARQHVSAQVAARMEPHLAIRLPEVVDHRQSADGTQKWVFAVGKGASVETVFIPDAGSEVSRARGTLCVSSQAGCSLSCSFCRTGTQPFLRNLSSEQIVGQFMAVRDALRRQTGQPEAAPVTNLVYMGQGEPLYNMRGVFPSVNVLTSDIGGRIANRRCTISTSGVAPAIPRVASETGVSLAVSLHAPTDGLRSQIMNINRTYPLPVLLEACRAYSQYWKREEAGKRRHGPGSPGYTAPATGRGSLGRRIVFEYVMLAGVNDQDEHADALVRLLDPFHCIVNLIPFNPWEGAPYGRPEDAHVLQFGEQLLSRGIPTSVRWPRGQDILAACGQLRAEHMEQA